MLMIRRQESRVTARRRVFIRVLESVEDRVVGLSLKCRSVDYSTRGMKLRIANEWIRSDSVLEIVMAVVKPRIAFNLTGKVRWSTPENEGCSLGLTIREEGDFPKWSEYVRTFLDEPA